MTTIATDGKTIAADSLTIYNGRERGMKPATKMVRHGKRIYASAGSAGILEVLAQWAASGAALPDPLKDTKAEWDLLELSSRGVRHMCNDVPFFLDVLPPFAIGSGSAYALGAMHVGATPEEAVRVAAMLDCNTGGEIVAMHVSQLDEHAEAAE